MKKLKTTLEKGYKFLFDNDVTMIIVGLCEQ